MVHVCFGLNDAGNRYSKFTGIAIMSIFRRTAEEVTVHILYDETVDEKNLKRLKSLGDDKYKFIKLYRIESDSFVAIKGDGFNIGTMYRLAMPDIIPQNVDKLIYLDSDIIVNLDIKKLYDLDLKGKSLAALSSPAPGFWVYDEKIVDNYFNNGVMLLDLRKIRQEHNLLKETKAFFDMFGHEPTCDQDAFNYIFREDWMDLPKIFNDTTIELRGQKAKKKEFIYHFAGDVPSATQIEEFDRLFFEYWLASPWVDQFQEYFIETVRLRDIRLNFMERLTLKFNKNIAIWGAGSIYLKKVLEHLPKEKILLVDGDKNKWNKTFCGLTAHNPNVLDKRDEDYIVFVLSGNYYGEITQQLIKFGFNENENYFDGRLLLSEDEGGKMVPVNKGNLRDLHFRHGSINADLLTEKDSNR